MRPSIRWSWSVAVALACAACGAQVVSFDVDLGDGGSVTTASFDATSGTGAIADATIADTSSPPFSGLDSSSPPFGHRDASAPVCIATCVNEMGACNDNTVCCGQGSRCFQGLCTPSENFCLAPGMPCPSFLQCCSGRCEPSGQGTSSVCAPFCALDTSPCTQATDCCSLACNDGVCGGGICSTAGSLCQVNSDCCSNTCVDNRCIASSASCLASGDSCGDGGNTCCSGSCNMDTGRCAAASGYQSCLPKNSPCSRDFPNCCDNAVCATSPSAHASTVPTCQSMCIQDNERCLQNSDCCSKGCNDSGLCGSLGCITQQ